MQRKGDSWLASHVELGGVRDEANDAHTLVFWATRGKPAQLWRRCANRGSHKQVELRPPIGHPARPGTQPLPALQVPDHRHLPADRTVHRIARLYFIVLDRAAERALKRSHRCLGVCGDDGSEVLDELRIEHGRRRRTVDTMPE